MNKTAVLSYRRTNRNLAIPIIDCTRNKENFVNVNYLNQKIFILDGTENDVMGFFLLLTGFLIAVTSPVSKI